MRGMAFDVTGSAMPYRLSRLLAAAAIFIAGHAYSLTAETAKAIAVGESDTRVEALRAAVAGADEKTVQFIQALSDDAVKVVAGKTHVVETLKPTGK